MPPPTVSVIIPNYNHGRFLARRIESVLAQTFQDFEVIVLDDASTDNSRDVIARYSAKGLARFRTFFNDENTGRPGKQWNKGVAAARGRYIWIAESDDQADPRFLEVLVALLDNDPHVGLAYCQSWEIDAQDVRHRRYTFHTDDLDPQRWRHDYVNRGKDECQFYLSRKNTIPNASAVLFRKDVYEAVGGTDETLRYCFDWLLWFDMLMRSDVAFVAEPLNEYRRHDEAFSFEDGLEVGRTAHAVYHRLLARYQEVVYPFPDARKRWPARLQYELGRHALREGHVTEARRCFIRSLRLRPFAVTALFWGASFLGRQVYQYLDGIKLRVPLLGRLLQPDDRSGGVR